MDISTDNESDLRDDRLSDDSPVRREDPLASLRGYREVLREPGQGEPPRSHPSINDPFRRQSDPQQPINALEGLQNRQLHSHPPERSYSGEYPRSSLYDQARAPGEEMQRSRSFLGITDPSRRGRASPLPQAVQGAQPQLTGPGGDPSIKREFGAIFQGLGSGLGGHIPGSSTPSRQSPMPQRMSATDDIAPIVLSDNDGTMSRTGSRGPRKNKRVKDELDGRMDIDGIDGRNTPSSRGAKRTKISHHHHLPHTHPYVDSDHPRRRWDYSPTVLTKLELTQRYQAPSSYSLPPALVDGPRPLHHPRLFHPGREISLLNRTEYLLDPYSPPSPPHPPYDPCSPPPPYCNRVADSFRYQPLRPQPHTAHSPGAQTHAPRLQPSSPRRSKAPPAQPPRFRTLLPQSRAGRPPPPIHRNRRPQRRPPPRVQTHPRLHLQRSKLHLHDPHPTLLPPAI